MSFLPSEATFFVGTTAFGAETGNDELGMTFLSVITLESTLLSSFFSKVFTLTVGRFGASVVWKEPFRDATLGLVSVTFVETYKNKARKKENRNALY